MPIITCEIYGFFLAALHLSLLVLTLFLLIFPSFFVRCSAARIHSLSQYSTDCCCCRCRHLHRYCSAWLQTSTRKLQLQQQQQTTTRCTSVSKVHNHVLGMCVCLYMYVQYMCKFLVKIVPHITQNVYIQYTFCSLTCSCSWRFYSVSTPFLRCRVYTDTLY